MSRYHFWSLPPNAMPTFSRSYATPHSSAHHSTFMTLIELTRPQTFITRLPALSAFPNGLAVDELQQLLGVRQIVRLGRYTLEPDVRPVNPDRCGTQEGIGADTLAFRHGRDLGKCRRVAAKIDQLQFHASHQVRRQGD